MSKLFDWALTADGEVVELYLTRLGALRACHRLQKRAAKRGKTVVYGISKLRKLFDGR